MVTKEIKSADFPIFAHYVQPIIQSQTLNLFNRNDHTAIRNTGITIHGENIDKIIFLESQGALKSSGDDFLIPLEGRLVYPNTINGQAPLVLIGHGMASAYIKSNITPLELYSPLNKSYEGYQILQEELAQNGIVSFSINLNIVNEVGAHFDFYQRILIFFLNLSLVKLLVGEQLTQPQSVPYPIKYVLNGQLENFNVALQASSAPAGNTQLEKLNEIKDALTGKIDFERIGLMGHSRGASAVNRIFEYFFRNNPPGSPVAGASSSNFNVNASLEERIVKMVEFTGSPNRDTVKCILTLEPDDTNAKIESEQTLLIAVAGSHDEDVGPDAFEVYDTVECPKVMFFIHGATHGRFNTEWRRSSRKIADINEMIRRESTVRVLSNRKHDDISRVIFSSCFIAALNDNSQHFLHFSRDVRYPVFVDIQRAWQFGYPLLSGTTNFQSLDSDILNTIPGGGTLSDVVAFEFDALSFDSMDRIAFKINRDNLLNNTTPNTLSFSDQSDNGFYFAKTRNSDTASFTIPFNATNLDTFSHFGFRMLKYYKVRKNNGYSGFSTIRVFDRNVDFRNFSIQLFENTTALGRVINGVDIHSLFFRAYPALVNSSGSYSWDTQIILQTLEVPMSAFGVRTADLSRVNMLKMILSPTQYKAPDDKDIFLFNDFTVSKRAINMPAIP